MTSKVHIDGLNPVRCTSNKYIIPHLGLEKQMYKNSMESQRLGAMHMEKNLLRSFSNNVYNWNSQ